MPFHRCTINKTDGTMVCEEVDVSLDVTDDNGDVRWHGTLSVTHLAELKAGLTYSLKLDDGRTGAQLLDYLTRLQGRPPLLRDALLERFDLPHSDLRRRIKTYSQGMRQKLALVQALQHDPALLAPVPPDHAFKIAPALLKRGACDGTQRQQQGDRREPPSHADGCPTCCRTSGP